MNDPVSALARPADQSRPGSHGPRRLPEASIGIVPIVWNNVDLTDLAPAVPPDLILATVARLGFQGVQFGRDFPIGKRLAATLATRGLRLAEVYAEVTLHRRWADRRLAGARARPGSTSSMRPAARSSWRRVTWAPAAMRVRRAAHGRAAATLPGGTALHRAGLAATGGAPGRPRGRDGGHRPSACVPSARRDPCGDPGRSRPARRPDGPAAGEACAWTSATTRSAAVIRWRRSAPMATASGMSTSRTSTARSSRACAPARSRTSPRRSVSGCSPSWVTGSWTWGGGSTPSRHRRTAAG